MGSTPRIPHVERRLREVALATAAGRAVAPGAMVIGDWTLRQDENGDLVAVHFATGQTRVIASIE